MTTEPAEAFAGRSCRPVAGRLGAAAWPGDGVLSVCVLPAPKCVIPANGTLPVSRPFTVAPVGEGAAQPTLWIARLLRDAPGLDCRVTEQEDAPRCVVGLLADLQDAGLAPTSWKQSPAFASALGREQGYIVDVSERRAILTAAGTEGLRHAGATLRQLVRPEGIPCVHIEDRPDFRFRVADWLLNAEINRWAYERGDGREALFARLRRKVDLAARYKLNVIWFDGCGWSLDRAPGYAEAVRGLSRYARQRGVRLAHVGYGGGYGFAYQKAHLYRSSFMGQAYENRRPYPDGELYDCIGHPAYAASWRYGTCLSNERLLHAKLDELTRFVRACEPGMLYIHDIDTGEWALAAEAWLRRCDECRRRWPSDDAGAEDGMAGAYAEWFRRLADAVSGVAAGDEGYLAERDCELVFVGPVYTAAGESDAHWERECRYFETLSRMLGPAANVQFGIREQLVSDREPKLRVRELAERLGAVGHGHGIFVIAFAGGDGYYSDQLVSPAATLNRYALGAETAYVIHTGGVAEPAQLVVAEYCWNATASGAAPIAADRQSAMDLLQATRAGSLRAVELFGEGGLLESASRHLYGECAGPLVAEVLRGAGPGEWPVAAIWPSIAREARALSDEPPADRHERSDHWLSRQQAGQRAGESGNVRAYSE